MKGKPVPVRGPFPRCTLCDHPDFEHELCPRQSCAGDECGCHRTVEEIRASVAA